VDVEYNDEGPNMNVNRQTKEKLRQKLMKHKIGEDNASGTA